MDRKNWVNRIWFILCIVFALTTAWELFNFVFNGAQVYKGSYVLALIFIIVSCSIKAMELALNKK